MAYLNSFLVTQIILTALGLTFLLSSNYRDYVLLVTLYVVILLYLLIIIIGHLFGKVVFSPTIQGIAEAVLAVLLVGYTIYVAASCSQPDVWMVLAIIVGFILPALLFTSAYGKT